MQRPRAAAAAGVAGASSGLLSPPLAAARQGPNLALAFASVRAAQSGAAPGSGASSAGNRAAQSRVTRTTNSGPAFTLPDRASDSPPQGPSWGSRASAGVPAIFGAFTGLQARPSVPRVRRRLDPRRLIETQPDAQLHTDAQASFEIGGRALGTQASGLRADVGLQASLNDRIRFDGE
jgi:hypothetical protein